MKRVLVRALVVCGVMWTQIGFSASPASTNLSKKSSFEKAATDQGTLEYHRRRR